MAAAINQPRTPSELELYHVLSQARLLSYYSAFIAQGGDDVSQLADASEEEFHEILNLVGMARKILHIRRLQKVLHEWRKDRSPFQRPIIPFDNASVSSSPSPMDPSAMTFPGPFLPNYNDSGMWGASSANQAMNNFPTTNPSGPSTPIISSVNSSSLSPMGDATLGFRSPMDGAGVPVSLLPNVTLSSRQMEMIAQGALDLSRVLPPYPPREVNAKKQVSRAITAILTMAPDDPKRESEVRLYSPIYGRFDSPRRTGRPMTFHEVAVNEAAAQLSLQRPSLLTRRDDLFCLARQVVKMMEQNFHASTSTAMRTAPEGYAEEEEANTADCQSDPQNDPANILKLQVRLQELSAELAEVVAQQDNVRSIMRSNKADQTLCVEMQHEMDQLGHRQAKITNEQVMVIGFLRRMGADVPSRCGALPWMKIELPEEVILPKEEPKSSADESSSYM